MTTAEVAAELQRTGPMSAADLAHRLGVKLQALYGLLITAEALGLVRVAVDGGAQQHRAWEAMEVSRHTHPSPIRR